METFTGYYSTPIVLTSKKKWLAWTGVATFGLSGGRCDKVGPASAMNPTNGCGGWQAAGGPNPAMHVLLAN